MQSYITYEYNKKKMFQLYGMKQKNRNGNSNNSNTYINQRVSEHE